MEKEARDLLCPACGYGLAAKEFHGQIINKCFECGGMWLGSESLRSAQHQIDDTIDWPENLLDYAAELKVKTGREMACPEDGAALVSLHYGPSKVVVDICPLCSGVWFDRDEFDSIRRDLEDASVDKTSLGYLKDMAHELAEVITGEKGMTEELEDVKEMWHLFKNRLAIDHPYLVNFIVGLGKTFS